MDQVNERSTAYLSCTFKDKTGSSAAPSEVVYRVDDVFTGTQLIGDTEVVSGATVEITIEPEANRLLGAFGNERRRVTVTATYGASDAVRGEKIYEVVDLKPVA